MDRSDPPLFAAADPPTVKTEPPGPAADGATASAPPASDTGAGDHVTPEPQDAQPQSPSEDHEVAVAANADPEPEEAQPQSLSEDATAAVASNVHSGAPETYAQAAVDDAAFAAPAESAPAPSAAWSSLAVPQMQTPGASAPLAASPAPAQRAFRPLLADWDRARTKAVAVRAGKVAAIVFSAWLTVVLFLIVVYRFVNPPFSSLMVMQWVTGTSIERQWAPIEEISPNLVRAVIASEDGRFCSHWGIDFAEIAAAIQRTSQGVPRGASTITMQVAKNLFLWPAKSYVRKVIEVPLTYAIEIAWPKRRILEVYLNIAEWGPGVFGAEAAAQEHFSRSAARLSARQAAQLAVALPNPFKRDAGDPGPWTSRRASVIQARAARSPEAASCILGGD